MAEPKSDKYNDEIKKLFEDYSNDFEKFKAGAKKLSPTARKILIKLMEQFQKEHNAKSRYFVVTYQTQKSGGHSNQTQLICAKNVAEIAMRCEALRLKYTMIIDSISIVFISEIDEFEYNQYGDYLAGFELSLQDAENIIAEHRKKRS